MSNSSKLEKVLELLINEEKEEASKLLHEWFVEKAREIHQRLVEEDEEVEDVADDLEHEDIDVEQEVQDLKTELDRLRQEFEDVVRELDLEDEEDYGEEDIDSEEDEDVGSDEEDVEDDEHVEDYLEDEKEVLVDDYDMHDDEIDLEHGEEEEEVTDELLSDEELEELMQSYDPTPSEPWDKVNHRGRDEPDRITRDEPEKRQYDQTKSPGAGPYDMVDHRGRREPGRKVKEAEEEVDVDSLTPEEIARYLEELENVGESWFEEVAQKIDLKVEDGIELGRGKVEQNTKSPVPQKSASERMKSAGPNYSVNPRVKKNIDWGKADVDMDEYKDVKSNRFKADPVNSDVVKNSLFGKTPGPENPKSPFTDTGKRED